MSKDADQVALIAARYNEFAAGYARWFSPVIRPMALPLLGDLPLATAERVVDVGCGIGALAGDIRAAAPNASLVGIDRAEGMLRLARIRAALPAAIGDAANLPVADSSADVCTAMFVLHHTPAPQAAISELRRVLRPGGVAGTATWGGARDHDAYKVFMEELNAAAPPNVVTLDSSDLLSTPEKMTALLEGAGFEQAHARAERFAYRWDQDHFWSNYTLYGRTRQRIASLPEHEQAALLERIRERLTPLEPEAWVWRPDVVFANGTAAI